MTALTPQQMRELADGRRTWMWHGDWDEEAEIALRAAADQLDAVQDLGRTGGEVERLRRAIEDAPHPANCDVFRGSYGYPCSCWKAGVL